MSGCTRFISEDPIGWASGQTNNYAYVGGNPIRYRDPSGLYCLSDAAMGGIGGAVGGGFSGVMSGLFMGNPAAAVVLGGLGAVTGGLAGYVGTDTCQAGGIGGAGAAIGAAGTDGISNGVGGVVGGFVAVDLTETGMRDTSAGIIGGGVGGALGGGLAGFIAYKAMEGVKLGGLVGLSGAALGSGVTEALRFFNSCSE